MSQLTSRYPGARPFETEQQLIFKGRQADTEAVFRLISLEPLTVLYGKSGTGKSSLLNAGVIPKMKAETDLLPVRVRFNAYQEGGHSVPPAETARLSVRGGAAAHATFLDKLIPDEATLWHDVKEHFVRHGGERGLLLVVDQFEELFTYPAAQVQAFAEQLAEALFKAVPQRYWDLLQAAYAVGQRPLDAAELALFQHKPALKVVLSIRSDRVHLLNRLDGHLPTLLKNLCELDALSPAAARQAITEPAAMPRMDLFDSEPFLYAPEAVAYILDFLTNSQSLTPHPSLLTSQKIEATQLQIICSEVEKRAKTRRLQVVSVADVGNLEAVIEQYYDNQIRELDPAEQLPARRLVEEGLVFEEEERRLSLYEGQIFKTYGIRPDTVRQLVDAHLLRAEPSLSGGYTYELSHDTLVAPVLKAKALRLEAERRAAAERAADEREAELAAAKAEAAREKRRRQRAALLAWAAALAAVLAVGAAGYAWQTTLAAQKAEQAAKQSEQVARQAEQSAEDRLKALQQEKAKTLESRGDSFFQNMEYEAAQYEYQEALKLQPGRKDLEEKVARCREMSNVQ